MKPNFFDRWNKIADRLFVFGIILLLLAGLVRTVFFPKTHNTYENRYSNQIQAPSMSAIMDHSFQDSVEDALADQIPKAETLKKLYNTATSNMIDPLVRMISSANPSVYIKFRGMSLFGDHIVYNCGYMDRYQKVLEEKAENYNAVIRRHPDLEFYAYFIEKDTDIDFETGRELQAAEYMLSLLEIPDAQKDIYEVNSYEVFSSNFLKTDHHWNHIGAYRGYLEVHDLLGCDDEVLTPRGEKIVTNRFSGSKSASIGSSTFVEDFTAYVFDFPSYEITVNGAPASDYGEQEALLAAENRPAITYGGFYGSDAGEIMFDTGRTDRENILIIGESYDNAILKLLAAHYHKTFSIDLRNYEHYMESVFDIDEYIRKNQIDKVIFLGNLDFYAGSAFLLEG